MPLLPADFTQPSLQTILRINLDGTYHTITSAYSSYRHIKRLYFPNFIAAKQKTV